MIDTTSPLTQNEAHRLAILLEQIYGHVFEKDLVNKTPVQIGDAYQLSAEIMARMAGRK